MWNNNSFEDNEDAIEWVQVFGLAGVSFFWGTGVNLRGFSTLPCEIIIALGEALAYHMGFFLAGQRYGSNGDPGKASQNGGTTGYDLVALEVFDPNRAADVFKWIPKGLMLDLIDDTPIEATVNDKVSGYTNQQIFGALQSDVTRMSDYKAKLLLLYGTVQQTQINNLFASYHY